MSNCSDDNLQQSLHDLVLDGDITSLQMHTQHDLMAVATNER